MKKHRARASKKGSITPAKVEVSEGTNLRPATGGKAAAGMRTCTDCLAQFELADMAPGKRVCRYCQQVRVDASKEKRKPEQAEIEIDLEGDDEPLRFGSDAFSSRDSLSEMIKGNLGKSVNEANEMVELQKARLRAAVGMMNPKLISEASKDLQAAMEHRSQLTTKLMEKLQAMEDLRAKQEKAKPTTFYFNRYPKAPKIVPMRSMPEEVG